jgi:molecular chaperone GrpE
VAEKPTPAEREQERAPDPVGPGREAEEPTGADSAAVAADLDRLVDDLKRERDEYLDLAQRARADFENYRKRAAREGQEALVRGKTEVGRAVLPAVDALERAIANHVAPGREAEEATGGDPGGLAEGVALVHKELEGALAAAGITAIDPTGDAFDPELHEALSTRPAEDGEEPGTVVETMQRGYRIGETLIRPARVVVTANGT